MGRRRVTAPGPHQPLLFEPPVASITPLRTTSSQRRVPRSRIRPPQSAARNPPGAMVLQFHDAFGLPVSATPTLEISPQLVDLRRALLLEEFTEFSAALNRRDLVGVADALGDMVYVIYGTALTFGIDLDAVVAEVHRANMSKLDPNGAPLLRADGKVLKGPDYRPPQLAAILERQQLHTCHSRQHEPPAGVGRDLRTHPHSAAGST